jgi:hypothetical protein
MHPGTGKATFSPTSDLAGNLILHPFILLPGLAKGWET